MNSRLLRIIAPVAGALALVAAALLLLSSNALPFTKKATATTPELDLGKDPAPSFQLTNQDGQPVGLNDLRGKVVVVAFLYTDCPDVCPIIANKMGIAHDQLGARASDVAFVAISVDPTNDTVPKVHQFLAERNLIGKMTFLTGDAPTLQTIWTSYHVAVIPQAGGTPQAGGGKVAHNDALFVIDKSGRERWLVDSDFTPDRLKKLVADLLSE